MLSEDGDADAAVEARVGLRKVLNKFRQLALLLTTVTSKDVSLHMKEKLYRNCLRSSLLHGNGTWRVKKENELILQRERSGGCVALK